MMYSLSSLVSTHLAILYVLFIPGILLVLVSTRFIREAQNLIDGYDRIFESRGLRKIKTHALVTTHINNKGAWPEAGLFILLHKIDRIIKKSKSS